MVKPAAGRKVAGKRNQKDEPNEWELANGDLNEIAALVEAKGGKEKTSKATAQFPFGRPGSDISSSGSGANNNAPLGKKVRPKEPKKKAPKAVKVTAIEQDDEKDVDELLERLGAEARQQMSEKWDPLDRAIFSESENEPPQQSGESRKVRRHRREEGPNTIITTVVTEKKYRKGTSWLSLLYQFGIVLAVIVAIFTLKLNEDAFRSAVRFADGPGDDLYAALGVARNASKAQIRKAYRDLSRVLHPDKIDANTPECDDDDCAAKFELISRAYKVLGNQESRKYYDATGYVVNVDKDFKFSDVINLIYLTPTTYHHQILRSLEQPGSTVPISLGQKYSESPSGVWLVLVTEPRAAVTQHLADLWKEFAMWFDGVAGFVRVSTEDLDSMKLLPMHIRVAPAIIMLKPNEPPEIFPGIADLSAHRFIDWLVKAFPRPLKKLNTAKEVTEVLTIQAKHKPTSDMADHKGSVLTSWLHKGRDLRQPVVYVSPKPPNLLFRAAALRMKDAFSFFYITDPAMLTGLKFDTVVRATEDVLLVPEKDDSEKIRKAALPFNPRERLSVVLQDGKSRKLIHVIMKFLRDVEESLVTPATSKALIRYCQQSADSKSGCLIVGSLHMSVADRGNLKKAAKQFLDSKKGDAKENLGDPSKTSSTDEDDDDDDEDVETRRSTINKKDFQMLVVDSESLAFQQSPLGQIIPKKLLKENTFGILPDFPTGRMIVLDTKLGIVRERTLNQCKATKLGIQWVKCMGLSDGGLILRVWRQLKNLVS